MTVHSKEGNLRYGSICSALFIYYYYFILIQVLPKRQNLPSVPRGGRGRGRTGPIYGGRASFRGGYGGRGYFAPSAGRGPAFRGGRAAPRGGRFYRGRGPGRAPAAYQNPYY
jgi:hypothetical protein